MAAACKAYPDSMAEGYERRTANLELPDEGDRHVLAAAMESMCDAIVTYNLRDFPLETLASYGTEAIHPDELLMRMVEIDPDAMRAIMQSLVRMKAHPPRTMAEENCQQSPCTGCHKRSPVALSSLPPFTRRPVLRRIWPGRRH